MVFEKSVMRFAHANGHTQCCFTADGDHIITAGSDGDIRIWDGINDDDPTSKCVGEFVLALSHYAQRILVATDLNTVQALTFPDGDRDGTEFRFTAAVTCVRVDTKFITAGSEDAVIKVVDIEKTAEPFELRGHEGPVLHIDTHPQNEWLASASGDGTIRIWDLKTKAEMKCIRGLEKTKSFEAAKTFISPCFEPVHCKTLAYCNRTQILVVDTVNWETVSTYRYKSVAAEFTVCRYSPCGNYLAGGTVNGDICVWRVRSGEAIDVISQEDAQTQPITTLDWNPRNNGEMAYADNSGQLGTITYNSPPDDGDVAVASATNGNALFDDDLEEITGNGADDDDDDDNENCISLDRLKSATLKQRHDDIDDIDDLLDRQTARNDAASLAAAAYKVVPLQPAFQPAASPAQLEHRYLVWNSVGIVRAHSSDAENSIEVDFHDANVHHSIHLSNYLNHTMASLSRTVLALASETPSKLVCIALGASSREWSTSMSECDEIIALVATDKLVAVATDSRRLHIFSCMGTQREVIGLPGPVVSLAGHADSLCVVFHTAAASPSKEQPLAAMLVHAIGLSVRCRSVALPLVADARLQWLGYTERGSPVCADSKGMVWLYSNRGAYWMPICTTSDHCKSASDSYFVIDVCEQRQIVRAIQCRGTGYPLTTPKPIVQELPMQMPLCDLDSEKSQLEEQLLRFAGMDVTNAERQMKEVAIKLFALACRSEMETRAKELIEMIASPALLPLAIKYASKLGRIHLAEKLSELLPQLEEQEREREKQTAAVEVEAIQLLQNSPMTASLLLGGGGGQRDSQTAAAITPRPLFVSQQKRNPFKRGLSASVTPKSSPLAANALSHLTSKAVGFDDSQATDDGDSVPMDETIADKSPNSENKPKNANTGATTFMAWFKEHRDELQIEFPDAIPAELTKHGMRRFKALQADGAGAGTGATTSVNKRKLSAEESRPSGVSKLAKFGFSKN